MDFLELIQELCKTLRGHVQGCAAHWAASRERMSFCSKLVRFRPKTERKSPIKEKYLVPVVFWKVLGTGQTPHIESEIIC